MILQAEFYNKIGDLLFCKNGIPISSEEKPFWNPSMDMLPTKENQGANLRDYKAPIAAFQYYHLALSIYTNVLSNNYKWIPREIPDLPPESYSEKSCEDLLLNFVGFYQKSYEDLGYVSKNKNFLISIATNLSDMGDTLLSMLFHTKRGESAVLDIEEFLARYIRVRIATPGYSNHNNGLAIDLRNRENGVALRNSSNTAAVNSWRRSWFWNWLSTNANNYCYYQNTGIREPWHWEYRCNNSRAGTSTEAMREFGPLKQETAGQGTAQRVKRNRIQFLSFEGGGGKGLVYPGAIRALQELNLLTFSGTGRSKRVSPNSPIKGFSGASAGALTAFALSLGYDHEDIEQMSFPVSSQGILQGRNFNEFLDLPDVPGKIYTLSGCRQQRDSAFDLIGWIRSILGKVL
ncbi:MAG: patatin-like phospholipase family protein, partial [Bacteroidota bacterium]